MATLSEVLEILGEFYGLKPAIVQGQLKARIQNFQKHGIPLGVTAGKGKRIDYGKEEIYQLLICCELSEIGLLPRNIAGIISHSWKEIYWRGIQAAITGGDLIVAINPNLMSHEWEKIYQSETEKDLAITLQMLQINYDGSNQLPRDCRHLSILNLPMIVGDMEALLHGVVPPLGEGAGHVD